MSILDSGKRRVKGAAVTPTLTGTHGLSARGGAEGGCELLHHLLRSGAKTASDCTMEGTVGDGDGREIPCCDCACL